MRPPSRLESLLFGRGLCALHLALLLCCTSVEPATESSAGRALERDGLPVCLWIDFDGTLNTVGAFGWPFNPVPATELCEILSQDALVRATPLTARSGCWPSFQPGERACRVLEPTISVACSTGLEAALYKEALMRTFDDECARHVLLDDNEAMVEIEGGDPPLVTLRPIPWDWPATRAAIVAALEP